MVLIRQHRRTQQRQLVLDAVIARTDHPSADQIFHALRLQLPTISRATVYRNLHLLVELGLIHSVRLGQTDRYEPPQHEHDHVLCRLCGRVMDLCNVQHTASHQEVGDQTGYLIEHHHMVFEGVCPTCLTTRKQAPD